MDKEKQIVTNLNVIFENSGDMYTVNSKCFVDKLDVKNVVLAPSKIID